MKSKLHTNWTEAFTSIPVQAVPRNANVLGSHFVFQIKENNSNELKMKVRLVLHGNRDHILPMTDYLQRIKPVHIPKVRRDDCTEKLIMLRFTLFVDFLELFCI